MRSIIQMTPGRSSTQAKAIIDRELYPRNTNAATGSVLMALLRFQEGGMAMRGAVLDAIERYYPDESGPMNFDRAVRICDAWDALSSGGR